MQGNVVLPIDEYPDDYYAGDDWMTQGIRFIQELRESRPAKPFFLYVANNAMHSPLQAKAADIAKYRGRYDAGWTAARARRFRRQIEMGLVPPRHPRCRPPTRARRPGSDRSSRPSALCPTHGSVCGDDGQRRPERRQAGALASPSCGELDRTLIVFTSDNGGTDAGGAHGAYNLNRLYAGLPAAFCCRRARDRAPALGGPQQRGALSDGVGRSVQHTLSELQDVHRRGRPARVDDRLVARSHPAERGDPYGSSCT